MKYLYIWQLLSKSRETPKAKAATLMSGGVVMLSTLEDMPSLLEGRDLKKRHLHRRLRSRGQDYVYSNCENGYVAEVANMKKVLKESSVRLPRLYRTLSKGQSGYIVMEYVDGERLDHIKWETRTEREPQHIKTEIKQALISLSTLRSAVPGPVKNTARGRLFSVYGARTRFSSVHELEEWLTAKLFGEGSFIGVFDQLVMCHMDLNMRNLILDKNGHLFFLDWAHSGYYPPEFQEALLLYDIRLPHSKCTWTQNLLEVHREVYGSGNGDVVAKLLRVLQNNNGPRGVSHLLNGEQGIGPPPLIPREK